MVFASGFVLGRLLSPRMVQKRTVEVLTRIDTVMVKQPEVMVIQRLAPVAEPLPVAGSGDTVVVEVPREQRIYERPDFRAYVSGFHPSLDSIAIYRHETTRTLPKQSPRLSVGIQAGYGYTPVGFSRLSVSV